MGLIAAFLVWAAASPQSLGDVMTASMNWTAASIGWSYLVVTGAWLVMILCAVMGIGLISYGVAEPISHFMAPPHARAQPETMEAAVVAMKFSSFHWGLHAWAVFGIFGLAIGYSTHRKKRPGLVSPMLRRALPGAAQSKQIPAKHPAK